MTSAETLRALVAQGRHAQALAGTEGSTDPAVMILRADLLKAEGRLDEALTVRRAVVAARPTSAVAEHNLAALLGDMHQAEAAEAAVRRAFAKGGDAPETWLVLARALLAQSRHADAEAAFTEALRRRPAYVDAVRELTQLIWMRTADSVAALRPVEAALTAAPTSAALPHEHFARPAPGRLVLFPSWLWHGTVPFEGQGQRLTIAFDVVPA